MKFLRNKQEQEEEHNFWMSYTDLMSGLLIVFIIGSLVAYNSFQDNEKLIEGMGGKEKVEDIKQMLDRMDPRQFGLWMAELERLEASRKALNVESPYEYMTQVGIYEDLIHTIGGVGQLNDLRISADSYNKMRAITEFFRDLENDYFEYNEQYSRIEYKKHIEFKKNSYVIQTNYVKDLVAAGNNLVDIIKDNQQDGVYYKIIIEGRAAMFFNTEKNTFGKLFDENNNPNRAKKRLSYNRAVSLYDLWRAQGIVEQLQQHNVEILMTGSGIEGTGRYKDREEDKNKRFIIQVIPYTKFNESKN